MHAPQLSENFHWTSSLLDSDVFPGPKGTVLERNIGKKKKQEKIWWIESRWHWHSKLSLRKKGSIYWGAHQCHRTSETTGTPVSELRPRNADSTVTLCTGELHVQDQLRTVRNDLCFGQDVPFFL